MRPIRRHTKVHQNKKEAKLIGSAIIIWSIVCARRQSVARVDANEKHRTETVMSKSIRAHSMPRVCESLRVEDESLAARRAREAVIVPSESQSEATKPSICHLYVRVRRTGR